MDWKSRIIDNFTDILMSESAGAERAPFGKDEVMRPAVRAYLFFHLGVLFSRSALIPSSVSSDVDARAIRSFA